MNFRKSAALLALLFCIILNPWPVQAKSRQAVVKAASVAVYQKASNRSKILGTLPKGTVVMVSAVQKSIARIYYAGKTGYVKKNALQLVPVQAPKAKKKPEQKVRATPAPAAPDVAVKTTPRSGNKRMKTLRNSFAYLKPDASSRERTTVRKGTSFEILGSKGSFYQVKRAGKTAYLPQEAFAEPTPKPAPTIKPTPTPKPTPAPQLRSLKADSKLYKKAHRTAKVLKRLKAGQSLLVQGEGKRFAFVSVNGLKGYVPLKAFAAPAPAPTPTPAVAAPKPTATQKATATPAPQPPRDPDAGAAETVIAAALAQLGKPYVYGSTGPGSFDCSGLTYFAYKKVGVRLAHSAYSVGYGAGRKLERSQLKRGDIVCFNTIADRDQSDHVGIYLGNNQFVHASSGQARVVVSTLAGYYSDNFSWGRRVL